MKEFQDLIEECIKFVIESLLTGCFLVDELALRSVVFLFSPSKHPSDLLSEGPYPYSCPEMTCTMIACCHIIRTAKQRGC